MGLGLQTLDVGPQASQLRSWPWSESRGRTSAFAHGTVVVLPGGYQRDLGGLEPWGYIESMTLVLMMVVLAFGLLYVAVVAEERQMQEATKPRKR